MNDFDYECYLKKNIARSASRRKCGSKSKKCNLPTDHMTDRQWKERCGDVMSYQIGKPLSWAEFRKLPKDLKEEYMNSLIDKYSVNAKSFAKMFGVSVATIFREVKNENLSVKFMKGRHTNEDAFDKFLNGEYDNEQETSNQFTEVHDEPSDGEPETTVNEASTKENIPQTRFDSFTMNFSGKIDVNMIANSLRFILPAGGNARIKISCEME